jgi:mono/diheme cytochrome c family protein
MKARLLLAHLSIGLLVTCANLAAAEAKDNWSDHCAKCHGPDGKGRTKMGRKLKIKDLTAPKIQARLDTDDAEQTIIEGVYDNDGNERMPAFKDKLSAEERQDLRTYIRTLAAAD